MDDFWGALLPALVTGTVIGALATGLISLLKPWVDYGVLRATRNLDQKRERRVREPLGGITSGSSSHEPPSLR